MFWSFRSSQRILALAARVTLHTVTLHTAKLSNGHTFERVTTRQSHHNDNATLHIFRCLTSHPLHRLHVSLFTFFGGLLSAPMGGAVARGSAAACFDPRFSLSPACTATLGPARPFAPPPLAPPPFAPPPFASLVFASSLLAPPLLAADPYAELAVPRRSYFSASNCSFFTNTSLSLGMCT